MPRKSSAPAFWPFPAASGKPPKASAWDRYRTYRHVVLPQALRHMTPPLVSQAVSLIKDSALVSTIAIYDLTMKAQEIIAETYLVFELWFTIAGHLSAADPVAVAGRPDHGKTLGRGDMKLSLESCRRHSFATCGGYKRSAAAQIINAHPQTGKETLYESVKPNPRIVLMVCLVLAVTGVAPAMAADTQDSVVEQVIQRGVLRVGMSTFVPWAMKDKTGKLIGFEIDVARRLAEDMGVKVEFVPTKWSGIIPALLTGKFDVIIGGMGILPSRNLKVNFTTPTTIRVCPWWPARRNGRRHDLIEAFNKAGVIIAARLGSTAVTATKKYLPKAEIRMFDDEAQAYQEVINGRVHAVVGSAPTPAFQAIKYPDRCFCPSRAHLPANPSALPCAKAMWTRSTISTTGSVTCPPKAGSRNARPTGLKPKTGNRRFSDPKKDQNPPPRT
jgi:polar amino acid transport system substrate-binding protein